MHGPRSYRVDYYLWFTGDTEPTVIKSTDGEVKDKVYERLVRPRLVVTCADCWAKPEVRSVLPPSCPDPDEGRRAGDAGVGDPAEGEERG